MNLVNQLVAAQGFYSPRFYTVQFGPNTFRFFPNPALGPTVPWR